jgi:predicted RNA-binding Zn ribbon-like protein
MASRPAPILGEPLPLELANTRFAHRGHEQEGLREPVDLAAWLRQVRDRLPAPLSDGDLDRIGPDELSAARALRDALRTLFTAAAEGTPADADAAAVVNRAVRAAPWWRELATDGGPAAVGRTDGPPVSAALAAIADEAVGLLTGPDATALRACAAPGCMLFYRKDHPRRSWCSPRCSNRVRAARHYARRTAGG